MPTNKKCSNFFLYFSPCLRCNLLASSKMSKYHLKPSKKVDLKQFYSFYTSIAFQLIVIKYSRGLNQGRKICRICRTSRVWRARKICRICCARQILKKKFATSLWSTAILEISQKFLFFFWKFAGLLKLCLKIHEKKQE
nr:hypothetical protein C37H5.12 - Caenorhabditis elegans [Caenorhabditis elegans]